MSSSLRKKPYEPPAIESTKTLVSAEDLRNSEDALAWTAEALQETRLELEKTRQRCVDETEELRRCNELWASTREVLKHTQQELVLTRERLVEETECFRLARLELERADRKLAEMEARRLAALEEKDD